MYTRALAALQAGSQLDKPTVVPISQYLAVCGEADGSRGQGQTWFIKHRQADLLNIYYVLCLKLLGEQRGASAFKVKGVHTGNKTNIVNHQLNSSRITGKPELRTLTLSGLSCKNCRGRKKQPVVSPTGSSAHTGQLGAPSWLTELSPPKLSFPLQNPGFWVSKRCFRLQGE